MRNFDFTNEHHWHAVQSLVIGFSLMFTALAIAVRPEQGAIVIISRFAPALGYAALAALCGVGVVWRAVQLKPLNGFLITPVTLYAVVAVWQIWHSPHGDLVAAVVFAHMLIVNYMVLWRGIKIYTLKGGGARE